ncbi:MAG: type I restriction endonuclease subunit R [Gammaproteobacteria bacterium]
MATYTEATLAQKPTTDYLRDHLGWESVYAHNAEDFGPASLLGRASEREVVLTRILRQQLAALNPGLPVAAYDSAIRQLTDTAASQDLAAANREQDALLRNGVSVDFTTAAGERKCERLRVIDFDVPENNHFLCVRELWIQGGIYRRRADIIGFVNGLPLLFIECKNIHKNLKVAFETNYAAYRNEIPHLFHHNAVVMFTNGADAKIGSITGNWEHFHAWKRLAEESPGVVDLETTLKGVCGKRNFIDLFENFIAFDDSSGRPKKILARNHQFLGVNLAIDAVQSRAARRDSNRLGVFWHTQGAGKSYSMVFFARKVHRKIGGNFTFLVLTDRDDLDRQIYQTFAGCGLADAECRAADGAHLRRLLGENRACIFSLIQKFNIDAIDAPYSERDDIIVISDEAHRSQYGTLAHNMRSALPNAGYIGFTGTPLFAHDEITQRVFGEYVSTYDFQRAVEDHATVPLFYEARGEALGVGIDDLNERIAAKLEEFETDDLDILQRLERELQRDYHVITAGKRLGQIAQDFVRHYSNAWESGKAMLVCIDKITCARMHKLIGHYWGEHIKFLEQQRAQARRVADAEGAETLRQQIAWMHETRMAVVISEEQGEVEKFRDSGWNLDIIPHRRLMKQGIELPAAMRARFHGMQRMDLDQAFKQEAHPFRVAIVCAMWMTGFDVPCLAHLYLDKPLKAHTLMQAIARANRVNAGKNNGLIIDYCGILRHLRRALATFAGAHRNGGGELNPAQPASVLLDELAAALELARAFLAGQGASLDDVIGKDGLKRNAAIIACKEAANENDETRKRFEIICREVFVKFKACINIPEASHHRAARDAVHIIYQSMQQDRERADISEIIRELHEIVDGAIEVQAHVSDKKSELYDISKIDFERLKQEFPRHPRKHTTVQTLKSAIENQLARLLEQNPLRANFQQHYEEIIAQYNREKDRATIEQTFAALLELARELSEEERRAAREGLNEETLAVFDLLQKPELSKAQIKKIKSVAAALLAVLKAGQLRAHHWRESENTRDAVRSAIGNFLFADTTGLPDAYSETEVIDKSNAVFRHVMRAYPQLPSPFYPERVAA